MRNRTEDDGSSSISTDDMFLLIDKLKAERFRSSTKHNYYCVWKCFNKFFLWLDMKPSTWEECLTLFVGFLVKTQKKSNTIRSYISVIKAILMDIGIKLNEDRYLLTSLTRACKLNNDRIRTKLPIQKSLLHQILNKCERFFLHNNNQPYLSCLYRALFITAYYGMLRIGEVTSGDHPVKAVDVHAGINKRKLLLILRTLKTHGLVDRPQEIKITGSLVGDQGRTNFKKKNEQQVEKYPAVNALTLCPFTIVNEFIAKHPTCRKPFGEPFFIFVDCSAVTPSQARLVLQKMLHAIGLNKNVYSFHGLRAGRATDL